MINIQFVIRWAKASCYMTLLVMLIATVASCNEKTSIESENLYGRWDIARAEKNGKATNYLRNGYFIINPDGNMTVNITGEDENGKYELDNQKLLMEGERVFNIQSVTNDSMVIKYSIPSGTEFLFFMLKRKDDAQ